MYYALIFLLGGLAFAVGHVVWEMMTGQYHAPLVRDLDEIEASDENEKLIDEFFQNGLPDWDRKEIWRRMSWLWKETRGWVFESPKPVSVFSLGLFLLLYNYVWIKTALFPNSRDLRLLLAGRVWILHIAQKQEQANND